MVFTYEVDETYSNLIDNTDNYTFFDGNLILKYHSEEL